MQNFQVGDQVKIYFKTPESGRAKTQVFSGVVIGIKGKGASKTFRVLKETRGGVKIERIFPLESPLLEKVEVVKKPKKVRRSKLYFLRDRGRLQL